jgi:hypothetical protein
LQHFLRKEAGYGSKRQCGDPDERGVRARKKYVVELTAEERSSGEYLLQKGKGSARKLIRTRILLKADEGLEDEEMAETGGTRVGTIERTRQRFVVAVPDVRKGPEITSN